MAAHAVGTGALWVREAWGMGARLGQLYLLPS